VPATLTVLCSSPVAVPCIDGFSFTIDYDAGLGRWTNQPTAPMTPCGTTIRCDLECIGGFWTITVWLNAPVGCSSGPMGPDSHVDTPFEINCHGIFGCATPAVSGRVDFHIT
jgi:hypothetical protein